MQEQRANFAIVLKAIRQERGLFQADLAALAGVPQPFVSRLERGEQDLTVLANVLRVIRALDVPAELIDRVLGLAPRCSRVVETIECAAPAIDCAERPELDLVTRGRDGPVAAQA